MYLNFMVSHFNVIATHKERLTTFSWWVRSHHLSRANNLVLKLHGFKTADNKVHKPWIQKRSLLKL